MKYVDMCDHAHAHTNTPTYPKNRTPYAHNTNKQKQYALDFSARAVDLVKSHPLYAATRRCRAFVCDLVNDPVPPAVVEEGGGALR